MGILNVKSAFQFADKLEEHLLERTTETSMDSPTYEEYEKLRQSLPKTSEFDEGWLRR